MSHRRPKPGPRRWHWLEGVHPPTVSHQTSGDDGEETGMGFDVPVHHPRSKRCGQFLLQRKLGVTGPEELLALRIDDEAEGPPPRRAARSPR